MIFYILLTVHLGMILANNQLDTLPLMYLFILPLHVLNSTVFIIRRLIVLIHHLVCINTIDLLMMNTVLFETCTEIK